MPPKKRRRLRSTEMKATVTKTPPMRNTAITVKTTVRRTESRPKPRLATHRRKLTRKKARQKRVIRKKLKLKVNLSKPALTKPNPRMPNHRKGLSTASSRVRARRKRISTQMPQPCWNAKFTENAQVETQLTAKNTTV